MQTEDSRTNNFEPDTSFQAVLARRFSLAV